MVTHELMKFLMEGWSLDVIGFLWDGTTPEKFDAFAFAAPTSCVLAMFGDIRLVASMLAKLIAATALAVANDNKGDAPFAIMTQAVSN